MPRSVTHSIKDNQELRIAKNFLIISILLYVLYVLLIALFLSQGALHSSYLSVFSWIIKIVCFAFSTAGFYKLSKLGRSLVLFKNYMLFIVGAGVFSIATYAIFKIFFGIGIFDMSQYDLQKVLANPAFSWLFILMGVLYLGLCVYWSYKIFFELTCLSGDTFFINGFKILIASIGIALIANMMFFVSQNQISSFLFLMAMIGMLAGSLMVISGFFRLKQITYNMPE
ncbi:hypothetical protein [Helicobacter sp. 11S02596-1]|uniref:hypothetical protein n=1 Tax=Helicobacter sp. 11S02596-1 TaxID=1476194 RepID=UPI000BA78895|nr:hypothetical protein [Helicobacter sp. 11S02596-1]PAF41752.1 hypothetical protein BJI48_07805 [Helicobacter sp. 11S02596-1]